MKKTSAKSLKTKIRVLDEKITVEAFKIKFLLQELSKVKTEILTKPAFFKLITHSIQSFYSKYIRRQNRRR